MTETILMLPTSTGGYEMARFNARYSSASSHGSTV